MHDPRIPFNYDNSFVYIIPKAGLGITDDAAIREMLPKSEIGGVSRGWYAENIWPEVHGQTPAYLAGNYLAYNYSFNSNSYSQLGDTPDNNPALVFLDYVVSDIYGAGIPIADLSMQSIIDSANYCDQLAPTTSISLSQNQMACNLSVNTENTLRKNIEDILQTCRGKVAWIDGQYHLDINKAGAPVAGVLDTQIIKRTAVSFGKRENRLNRIIGTYSEPNNGYNEMQVVYPPVGSAEDMQWRITEDKGVLNEKEIRLAGCTNAYQAVDLLATHIRESRNSIRAEYECNLEALMFTLGDIILVTDPTGLWTNKMCKIINWTLDFTRRIIKLRVAEHSDAAYDNLVKPILVREEGDIINTYQEFNKNLNVSLTSGDETLYVGPDGSIQAGLRVDWDENTAAIGFDIEYKLSSDESYTKIPIASSTARTAMIRPIISGEKYDVQIRARGRTRLAEWQQVNNFTALGKQLLPPDVVQFFVDGNNLSWVEPELKPLDLSGYVLRYHVGESRDWSTAQPMHSGVITQTQYQVPFALYDKMVLLIKSIEPFCHTEQMAPDTV
ncbi:MAG: hypothetical protein HRU08_11795, partial [Oleispira sp.]|nr:hypothetical protein [Oleispira sp.]